MKLDIYTFKIEFLKIYERKTPKKLLPDLTKNNLLSGQAFSLVNSVEEIEEIWKRLVEAYGDTKMLLKKRLSQVEVMPNLNKTKEASKVAESSNILINTIIDWTKLARKHDLEQRLYYGDGINKIYRLLDETRMRIMPEKYFRLPCRLNNL